MEKEWLPDFLDVILTLTSIFLTFIFFFDTILDSVRLLGSFLLFAFLLAGNLPDHGTFASLADPTDIIVIHVFG